MTIQRAGLLTGLAVSLLDRLFRLRQQLLPERIGKCSEYFLALQRFPLAAGLPVKAHDHLPFDFIGAHDQAITFEHIERLMLAEIDLTPRD